MNKVHFILQIPAQLTVNDIQYKIDDILLDTSLLVANDGKDLKSVARMLMTTPAKRIDRYIHTTRHCSADSYLITETAEVCRIVSIRNTLRHRIRTYFWFSERPEMLRLISS